MDMGLLLVNSVAGGVEVGVVSEWDIRKPDGWGKYYAWHVSCDSAAAGDPRPVGRCWYCEKEIPKQWILAVKLANL